MSDLEDLKQQLYAKIQASQKPEKPPSELDLLKYSQLPAYQAHQRQHLQTEQRWMESPLQGAIPTPLNPLYEVGKLLKSAFPWLENAYALMNSNGLDKTHRELYTAVGDAMTAVREGCARVTDGVDE